MTPGRGGRSRPLLVGGALLAVVACTLPWGRTASAVGALPSVSYGFDGPGVLVFVAAATVLALLALPYAAGRPVPPLDGGLALVALPYAAGRPVPPLGGGLALVAPVALGAVGLVVRGVQLVGFDAIGLPDRSPGLWLATVGVALMAVGAAWALPNRPPA